MPRRPTTVPAALAVATALVAACSGEGPFVPEGDAPAGSVSGGADTRPDSAAPGPLPAAVRASGHVYAVTYTPGTADSLRYTAVAGARVQLWRNVLENGASAQRLARELVTDAAGAYAAAELEGGYYVVKVSGPAGAGFNDSWEYLPATKPEVTVNVYLWARR
jgi:hypothetical protein